MTHASDARTAAGEPGFSGAVTDLLGLLAYAELVAFFRMADDAGLAPTLADKGELAGLAAVEYSHYRRLRDRLVELGADPEESMRPFVGALDSWHARTTPQSWLESLVKAYVGDGLAGDFYRQVAELADPDTRDLVAKVLTEDERAEFVAARVRAAVADDPTLAGRLSLWARRLVGEALNQAQLVAVQRPELAALLITEGTEADPASADMAAVSRIFAKLSDSHSARIAAMGLSS